MRGWYNIHDHTNLRMGFVPYSASNKSVPTVATSIPTTPLPDVEDPAFSFTLFGLDGYEFLLIMTIAVVCTAVTVLIVTVFCYSILFKNKLVKKCDQSISFKDKEEQSDSQISLIIL